MSRNRVRRTVIDEREPIDADFCAGLEEAKEKVARWLEKLLESSEVEGGIDVAVFQLGAGMGASPIERMRISQADDVGDMSDRLVDAAYADGNEIGHGTVKYQVEAKDLGKRVTFVLEYAEMDVEDNVDELPNERGMVAQHMRHVERFTRLAGQMIERTEKRNERMMSLQEQRIHMLESERTQQFKLWEATMNAKQLRDLELAKVIKAEERKDKAIGFLGPMIPRIVNGVVGKRLLAERATPLEQMIEGLMVTMGREGFHAFIKTLMETGAATPEQGAAWIEMFKLVHERLEARAAEEKAEADRRAQAASDVSNAGHVPDPKPETPEAPTEGPAE